MPKKMREKKIIKMPLSEKINNKRESPAGQGSKRTLHKLTIIHLVLLFVKIFLLNFAE